MSSVVWPAATFETISPIPPVESDAPESYWAAPGVRRLRVGLLGCGRIGQAVVATARAEAAQLAAAGIDLTFVRALVRDAAKPRGVDVPVVDAAGAFPVDDLDILIEVIGGLEPARTIVARALSSGVPVVTANKTLVAHAGAELEAIARRHGVVFAYDAAVLAGVPFLGSLARRPLLSGAHRLAGIVNGTSHAITTALESNVPFAQAVADAIARGYAEPDSSADISGRDAAEKLTILLRLAGVTTAVAALTTVGIDGLTPGDFAAARRLGGTLKPVAFASLSDDRPGAWVGPAFVEAGGPIGRATGVTNVLQVSGAAGRHALDVPDVIFQGPGAGPAATAATIIDDVVEATEAVVGFGAFGARPALRARATGSSRPTAGLRASCDVSQPPAGSWFLRICAAGDRSPDRDTLASLGLPIVRTDCRAPFAVALTAPASWRNVQRATSLARTRGFEAVAFPVLD